MSESPIKNLLPRLQDRRAYFDYLDRWMVGTVNNLRKRMTTRAMTKAFLLETSRSGSPGDAKAALTGSLHQRIEAIDETLFRMRWHSETEDWALAEIENERYPVIYTAVDSDVANRRIDQLVARSSLLDRAWFSSSMFQQLWKVVVSAYPPDRFSRIVFEHESVYQRFEGDTLEQNDEDDVEEDPNEDERPLQAERRRARMQITERIGRMQDAVLPWERQYDPLASIVQLRVPAPTRGGYDVYYNGRFTNRSDSTTSFRQAVRDVTQRYRVSTKQVEDATWPAIASANDGLRGSIGAPLLIQFSEPLDLFVFDRWIATLRRKNNRFRLWGTPLSLGPGKVHIYAVDNHLWQPINLEITRSHVYAMLPTGTCGNTVHRLVTNIQRFVQPKVSVFVGDRTYDDFIGEGRSTKVRTLG